MRSTIPDMMNSIINTYAITPEIVERTSESIIIHHQRTSFQAFNNINHKFSYHCLIILLSNDQSDLKIIMQTYSDIFFNMLQNVIIKNKKLFLL